MFKLKITEEKIPFGARLTMAITGFFRTIAACVTAICLLPVLFIRTLFTTTRKVVDVDGAMQGFGRQQQEQSNYTEEDWKRFHNELYNDE